MRIGSGLKSKLNKSNYIRINRFHTRKLEVHLLIMMWLKFHNSITLARDWYKMAIYFAAVSLMVLLLYRYIIVFRQRNAYYRLQRRLETMKRTAMLRRQQQRRRRFRRQVIVNNRYTDVVKRGHKREVWPCETITHAC